MARTTRSDSTVRKEIMTILVGLVLGLGLLTGYGVAYRVLVYQVFNAGVDCQATPYYRSDEHVSAAIFWPAHQVDRRLRPEMWDDSPDAAACRAEFRRLLAEGPKNLP